MFMKKLIALLGLMVLSGPLMAIKVKIHNKCQHGGYRVMVYRKPNKNIPIAESEVGAGKTVEIELGAGGTFIFSAESLIPQRHENPYLQNYAPPKPDQLYLGTYHIDKHIPRPPSFAVVIPCVPGIVQPKPQEAGAGAGESDGETQMSCSSAMIPNAEKLLSDIGGMTLLELQELRKQAHAELQNAKISLRRRSTVYSAQFSNKEEKPTLEHTSALKQAELEAAMAVKHLKKLVEDLDARIKKALAEGEREIVETGAELVGASAGAGAGPGPALWAAPKAE